MSWSGPTASGDQNTLGTAHQAPALPVPKDELDENTNLSQKPKDYGYGGGDGG